MSKELELIRTLIDGANEYEKKTGNTNPTVYLSRNNLLVIEQALLKAQEPKHYLKWEDLKFPYSVWKNDEVVLNGEKIGMRYKSDYGFMDCDYKVVKIYNLKTGKSICKIYDKDKDFFNSLHLEWAKECSNCKKQHTNGCPNSSECYSKKDKPHWERVEE